jgi:hypothetical protein
VLLGDPALRIDPPSSGISPATPGEIARDRRRGARQLAGATLTLAGRAAEPLRDEASFATGVQREAETKKARARIEAPSLARTATTLRFELPIEATGAYAVNVFDAAGRRVRNLGNGAAAPGRFELAWDLRSDGGAAMPSGIYFVRLQCIGTSLVHRLIVLR